MLRDTKEIAKRIRQDLKKAYPNTKFSVTKESYSGGSSITVAVVKTDIRLRQRFEDVPAHVIERYNEYNMYRGDEIKNMNTRGYAQLNYISFDNEYNPEVWNNGTFLTKEGYELLKGVTTIVQSYNYDNSDTQVDYFDVNFYFHLRLGTQTKPFEQEVA